jgi:hypothetical protein
MNTRTRIIASILLALAAVLVGTAYASLTSKIVLNVGTTYTGSSGLGTSIETLNLDYSIDLASGSGANQANVIYSASRSLADDVNETLDLYASGTLTDSFGTALTMTRLKTIILYNTSTDASLKVGGGTTPVALFADASDIMTLPPGGKLLFSAPDATGVLLSTNKNLKLAHDGTGTSALVYKIVVLGVD